MVTRGSKTDKNRQPSGSFRGSRDDSQSDGLSAPSAVEDSANLGAVLCGLVPTSLTEGSAHARVVAGQWQANDKGRPLTKPGIDHH